MSLSIKLYLNITSSHPILQVKPEGALSVRRRRRTPLRDDELHAIKAWLTERARLAPAGDTFFVSERRAPLNRRTAWVAIRRYGELAELSVEAHPHMLRHACGYALADQGADTRLIQDYLGHRNIQHTVRYTATNPARFERLWR